MDKEGIKPEESPSDWMRRSLLGEQEAYRKFLSWALNFTRMIAKKRFAQWGIGSDGLLDDFVQEVILVIHKKRHTYSTALPVEPWVAGIIKFKSIDHLRNAVHQNRMISESEFPQGLDQLQISAGAEDEVTRAAELAEALSCLNAKQRNLLHLAKIDGLSMKEIAQKTGASESSVKVSLHRTMKSLRKRFGKKK